MDSLTGQEKEVVDLLVGISSGLSILGSAFILASYLYFHQLFMTRLRLIFFLSLADICASFFSLWSVIGVGRSIHGSLCEIQAAGIQYFSMVSWLWITAMAHNSFVIVVLRKVETEKFEKFYHLYCWGLPGIPVLVLFITRKFGPTGVGWCWIRHPHDPLRLVLFYLPLLILFLGSVLIYVLVHRQLWWSRHHYNDKVQKKLSLFILAFICCWSPALVCRLHDFFAQSNSWPFWVFCIQGTMAPLQGLCNALLWGNNKMLRSSLRLRMTSHESPGVVWEQQDLETLYLSSGLVVAVDDMPVKYPHRPTLQGQGDGDDDSSG
eukprot:TRINITY_DN24121_c0_g1_i1.p1 TRINITY_DN24121_c0_g1~~TRINITY_DN24121_c0_g1_i1.p1  ORF type:complete len:331 (-),score=53.91 TRINITY_DN24121_c0_g1_i1:17-979(-)